MRLQHRSWLRTPLVMWLGLAISLTLLCVSNTVLAHDIYSDLHDRDGRLCCNGQDCKPVQVTVLPNGSYYLPSTGEIIPADMATPSPNELFHHCIYYPMATEFDRSGPVWESKPKTSVPILKFLFNFCVDRECAAAEAFRMSWSSGKVWGRRCGPGYRY